MISLLHNLKFSLRLLVKSPAFTAGAVLSLAIAIAANTAIFSLVDSVLLRPLPVRDPSHLVSLHAIDSEGGSFHSFSYLDFRDLGEGVPAFEDVVAYDLTRIAWSVGDRAELVQGYVTSTNFFDVLGVSAVLGRTFSPDEGEVPGRDAVAVIGYDLWQERFAGDPAAVGREIKLNSYPFTIIGVAPEGFNGPFNGLDADVWVPLMMHRELHVGEDLEGRNLVWLELIARLEPRVTAQEAQAAVDLAVGRMLDASVEPRGIRGVEVRGLSPVPARLQGPITAFMTLLLVLTGTLLLVASFNVASMLLARATARRKEIAIRLSIGSTRGRLMGQLLTESVVLFLVAGAVGALVAFAIVALVPNLIGPLLTDLNLPVDLDMRLDARTLLFTLALCLFTGVAFGLAPLLQTVRPEVLPALQSDTGGAAGYRKARARSALMVGQIAVSLLLLILAGLLVRSLQKSTAVDPGFDPEGVYAMTLDVARHGYNEASGRDFYYRLTERIENLPGVEAASLASALPLGVVNQSTAVSAEGFDRSFGTDLTAVAPGFFELMGIPLLAGRDFNPSDRPDAPQVVIVNQVVARYFWPDGQAVGKTLWDGNVGSGVPLRVIAVAANSKYRRISEDETFFIYRPVTQKYHSELNLVARLSGQPGQVIPSIRSAVLAMDDGLPVVSVRPLTDHIGLSLLPQKVAAGLAGVLGVVGLVLVAVGIYGLMAYLTRQRVREVGIRMALGAQVKDIVRLMMRRGVILTAVGVVLGSVLALLAGRALSGVMYGVGSTLPLVVVTIALLLAAVALAASYLPARRSARIEPVKALRHQ